MELKLSDLHFGHEADPPINARRVGREQDIDTYAASIAAHGLIQALNVRQIGGKWYVADGNRRLAALRLRADRGEIPADAPIKCDETLVAGNAEEISVAANIIRAPLHDADTYETFRHLEEAGFSEIEIAQRFGIEPARVRRMLALGRLSPMILDAWRNDQLGGNPIQVVRAFTLAPSVREQERVFLKYQKSNWFAPAQIRAELGAGDGAMARHIRTIGLDAYVAAGGRVIEDLFGDQHVILDKPLAAKLASEKLVADVKRLEAEGWSWVALSDNLPQNWHYAWTRLKAGKSRASKAEAKRLAELEAIIEAAHGSADGKRELEDAATEKERIEDAIAARAWTADQKAAAGAVVRIDYNGDVSYVYGLVKPAPAKRIETGADGKAKTVSVISNALMQRVSIQATKAVQAAVTQQPRLGLVALLAGFLTGGHNGPIKVSHSGLGGSTAPTPVRESFGDAFLRLREMSLDELLNVAAGIAGQAVDLSCYSNAHRPFEAGAGVLTAAIEPAVMADALKQSFDPADYFGSVAKSFIVTAIKEAINEDEARNAEKLKKGELFDYAVKNVAPTGWLPPELRTASYSGPGAA